jgi:glycosyltransferase involved in cell wall biosynthesis
MSPRIAFITGGLKMGGTTTFLCNIASGMKARGIPCVVYSFTSYNPMASDFERLGIDLRICDDHAWLYEECMEFVLGGLKEFQPTVVVGSLGPISFEVLRHAPKGVLRLAMVQSDDPGVYKAVCPYTEWVDGLVGVSRRVVETFVDYPKLATLRPIYLPYGIPVPEKPVDRDFARSDRLRILYLGRLEYGQKRVHLFPQILKDLIQSGIPFHWTIAGIGGKQEELQRDMKAAMAEASPLQTVEFTGAVAYGDVPELLQQQDVYLLTSDFEGLPLSLLEAMAVGVCPVVSDLPSGVCEVVSDRTGILVNPDDVSGYAKAIIHLHHHRDELAAKALESISRVRSEFSVSAMTDRWLGAIQEQPPQANSNLDEWPQKAQVPVGEKALRFSPIARRLRKLAKALLGKGKSCGP